MPPAQLSDSEQLAASSYEWRKQGKNDDEITLLETQFRNETKVANIKAVVSGKLGPLQKKYQSNDLSLKNIREIYTLLEIQYGNLYIFAWTLKDVRDGIEGSITGHENYFIEKSTNDQNEYMGRINGPVFILKTRTSFLKGPRGIA